MNGHDDSQAGKHAAEQLAHARACLAERDYPQARQLFEQALSAGECAAQDYNDYGRVLNNLRELELARQAFASAIALDPGFAEAHNNLGHVLRALNEAGAAVESFRAAVRLQPDYARAYENLGTVLALTGAHEEAIAALEKALTLAPASADAHLNLAGLYRVRNAPDEAEVHVRKALRLAPALIDAHIQLASLLEARGELEAAMTRYREALKLDPLNAQALAGLADLFDKSGEYDQGLEVLGPGLNAHPDDPGLAVARARLLRRKGESEQALVELAAIRSRNPQQTERLPRYFFTLGDLYDERGEYDAAFEAYRQANQLKEETFDPDDIIDAVDALVAVFTPALFAAAPATGHPSDRPVFIVGMPRSGTSLVEQILASHREVFGAGELRLIVDAVRALGTDSRVAGHYPECIGSLAPEKFEALAAGYLGAIAALDESAARVTDKMPHNFLHLGLIRLMFPAARIIHCQRNPLDTILSCYFQDFASTAMAFSNSLEHLAIYYRQYRRLMQHWREVLPGGFLDVSYERLVNEPKDTVSEILAWIGLDWTDDVLEFHRNRRVVKTASHAQVRQPLYRRSLARHERYAKHLQPVQALLAPLDRTPDL